MAKSKTGEFKMDKPYGLTMRGIVKNSNDEILILRRHPKSRTNPHKWELPGGKVDPGEFFDEALVREIKEETKQLEEQIETKSIEKPLENKIVENTTTQSEEAKLVRKEVKEDIKEVEE